MGVRVLYDSEARHAALYDSVTGWAFGPAFHDEDERDGRDAAEAFLAWYRTRGGVDLRLLSDTDLSRLYGDWRRDSERREITP